MSDLGGYAGAILAVAAQIEAARATVAAAGDQASEALKLLGEIGTGSDNTMIGDTLAETCKTIESLDEVAGLQSSSAERLREYLGQRGL